MTTQLEMRTTRPMTAAEEMGLGPKKTALVLFTVVGCIGETEKFIIHVR